MDSPIQLYTTSDGSYNITVSFTSLAGQTVSASLVVFVETQPPTTPTLSINGALYSDSVFYTTFSGGYLTVVGLSGQTAFTYDYVQTGVSDYSISGPYTLDSPIQLYTTTDGSYNITVSFTSLAGQTVSASLVVFVETVNPIITALSISGAIYSDGVYYTRGGTFLIGYSGKTVAVSYSYTLSGSVSSLSLSGSFNGVSIPFPTTTDGTYIFSVQLTDLAGRTTDISSTQFSLLTTLPSPPSVSVSDQLYTNLSGAITHYTTATVSISGESGYTYSLSRNGQYVSSSLYTQLTGLSGSQTVSVTRTSLLGLVSNPSVLSWFVQPFSDPPILTLSPSQNTLRIDIVGEIGTSYVLTFSGANTLHSTGTISGLFALTIPSLYCGDTILSMSITNYAGYTTYSSPLTYSVPIVVSVVGSILTWNGQSAQYSIYRYNSDKSSSLIETVSNASYDMSQYSGLTITAFVMKSNQRSNMVTLTLPVNTQAVQTIATIEYLQAGVNSDTSSTVLKSILNTFDTSGIFVILPSGAPKLVPVSVVSDGSFGIFLGPSGSTISISTVRLTGLTAIYIAGEPNTSKTILFDSSYSLTITFAETSIRIGTITYSIGDSVLFGNDVYTVIWFGSVYLQKSVAPTVLVEPLCNPFIYPATYFLGEEQRIQDKRTILTNLEITIDSGHRFASHADRISFLRKKIFEYQPN